MLEVIPKKPYVYYHLVGNEVFYVGVGINERVLDSSAHRRSKRWLDFVERLPDSKYTVKIIKYFDNKKQAEVFEKSEIIRLKPIANLQGLMKGQKKKTSMINKKEATWRLTLRLEPQLKAKVERAAEKKRWSVNVFVEEALINAIAESEDNPNTIAY